jgi:hypothetical protein
MVFPFSIGRIPGQLALGALIGAFLILLVTLLS